MRGMRKREFFEECTKGHDDGFILIYWNGLFLSHRRGRNTLPLASLKFALEKNSRHLSHDAHSQQIKAENESSFSFLGQGFFRLRDEQS